MYKKGYANDLDTYTNLGLKYIESRQLGQNIL